MEREKRELETLVTADIEAGAQRVREMAFAAAWVEMDAPNDGSLGAEKRAYFYCDRIALTAAEAWRKIERQRRLGEVIQFPRDEEEMEGER